MKSGKVLALVLLVVAALAVSAFKIAPALAEKISYAQVRGESLAAREQLEGLSQARQLSNLFRTVAKAVQPAVVEIRTTKVVEQTMGNPFGDFFPFAPEGFRREFGNRGGRTRKFEARGVGSGVIVDADNGYIVTNNHVVADADKLVVVLFDGREIETDWVRRDPDTDLAVVKIDAKDLVAAPIGDSDKMEVGDWVLAVGSPMQLSHTVTAGIVSAKGRNTHSQGGATYANYIQTDAAINRGNSGGPLVNMLGEVVGINTAIVTPSGAFAGIGLSIPSNMVRDVLEQLVSKGKVSRGFLGVGLAQDDDGLLVRTLLDNSAAAKGGFKVGDRIVAVDGKSVGELPDVLTRIAAMKPDSKHTFTVLRKGEQLDLDVVMGERPDDVNAAFNLQSSARSAEMDLENYGLRVAELDAPLAERFGYNAPGGVVITDAAPQLGAMGVRPGLLLTRVDDVEIKDLASLEKAMDAAETDKPIAVRLEGPGGNGKSILLAPLETADASD